MNVANPTRAAFGGAFAARRVLVTGHTGFKGAWLCEWLLALGADVAGLALPALPTQPALFEQLGLAARVSDRRGDVRDAAAVRAAIEAAQPEFVFHLAAQPLVRRSYADPVETFSTNVMGTINVLEAVRAAGRPSTVVVATTDKVYENHGRPHRYREDEPLGGHDPYSASKAAAEMAVAAYRRSYFATADSPVRVVAARAGNVVGGGDWALDRIVPDCVRALQRAAPVAVRNPHATRPWQHVLEPLAGYLWLAARLRGVGADGGDWAAFNFGPEADAARPVAALVAEFLKHWPGRAEERSEPGAVHEAAQLGLDVERARRVLGWRPVWDFETTIAHTAAWYREVAAEPSAAGTATRRQIDEYVEAARSNRVEWAHD
ncbi:MAG: CDP-glucose 4,6-dehydratase [Opitutae bacterium]|nr:CDP-glucose 4,6-dehydratase [Opitutae bacterium]